MNDKGGHRAARAAKNESLGINTKQMVNFDPFWLNGCANIKVNI